MECRSVEAAASTQSREVAGRSADLRSPGRGRCRIGIAHLRASSKTPSSLVLLNLPCEAFSASDPGGLGGTATAIPCCPSDLGALSRSWRNLGLPLHRILDLRSCRHG